MIPFILNERFAALRDPSRLRGTSEQALTRTFPHPFWENRQGQLFSRSAHMTDPSAEGSVLQTRADVVPPFVLSPDPTERLTEERQPCRSVQRALQAAGIFLSDPAWRLSPTPFPLTHRDVAFFQKLGPRLWAFSQALNRLYRQSLKGHQPVWVHHYLDQGKPDALLEYARMKRFRDAVPQVIRPDIIPTETGMAMTELDSVPGGIGTTGSLAHAYGSLGHALIGGSNGMIEGFAKMLESQRRNQEGCLAIVVSDEAEDYRNEMTWVASQLLAGGMETYCVHPRDLRFTEERVFVSTSSGDKPVSLIYRFFELFDLKNIPKIELLMYSVKKGRVSVTPPCKPWMEEKSAFALLHHPLLETFWSEALGPDDFEALLDVIPKTWVIDPRPIPPSAIIPNLSPEGRAIADWRQLGQGTQKQRQFVLKPSGFSELAWGSRGVIMGHDLPRSEWAAALEHALNSFTSTPYVLQAFHKGRPFDVTYFDDRRQQLVPMAGRARLSPYYFVSGEDVTLGGILATICPKDKKVIHGMRDAILAPCSLPPSAQPNRAEAR